LNSASARATPRLSFIAALWRGRSLGRVRLRTQPRLAPVRSKAATLVLSLLLIGCGSAAAQAAAGAPPVIPWLDQRPHRASAHPPLAAACRAGRLHAHLFLQGATGSLVGGVELTNAGHAPCSLLGWPRLSFTGAAASTRWKIRRLARSPQPPDVLADPPGSLRALAPGKTASVSLFWSNWCEPGNPGGGNLSTPPDGLRVAFASRTSLVVPLAHAPRCDGPQAPSILSASPFTPSARTLGPSSRLPLRVTIVGPRPVQVKPGLRAFRVRRGELLHYRVALTNTGKTSFRFAHTSCPTYIEQMLPAPTQPYVLNCRPVTEIAPGRRVLFQMQIPIPASTRLGNNSLTWELAPKTYEAPFAPAALWVVR
jgi:hypothetical protein